MTPKIIDYLIAEGSKVFVQDLVHDLLQDGWQPFGSLAYCGEQEFDDSDEGVTEAAYAQPMVRYQDAPESLPARAITSLAARINALENAYAAASTQLLASSLDAPVDPEQPAEAQASA